MQAEVISSPWHLSHNIHQHRVLIVGQSLLRISAERQHNYFFIHTPTISLNGLVSVKISSIPYGAEWLFPVLSADPKVSGKIVVQPDQFYPNSFFTMLRRTLGRDNYRLLPKSLSSSSIPRSVIQNWISPFLSPAKLQIQKKPLHAYCDTIIFEVGPPVQSTNYHETPTSTNFLTFSLSQRQ